MVLVLKNIMQPSQGADGESEFDDDAMDEDELMSESEEKEVTLLLTFWNDIDFVFVTGQGSEEGSSGGGEEEEEGEQEGSGD